MNKTYLKTLFKVLVVSVFLLKFSLAKAQCAGTGTEITYCDKETNPGLQTINLFDLLTGETAGGVWIANSNFDSDALNEVTGELNLWEINRFGEHLFTYSNSACDASTSTITINLGGYPGESNQNPGANNVCQVLKVGDDDSSNIIDLFIFLDVANNDIRPDIGGTWTEDSGNLQLGVLNNEFFNFNNVPIGVYTFIYTVPAVDTCPERFAVIDVEVRRAPNPGLPQNINICETDDMSGLTAINLFDQLQGEDPNGEWTDVNIPSTGEISSGTDFEINIENIYNNFGPGTYSFAYEVLPSHPICDPQSTMFTVCIEEQLNLDGSLAITCDGAVTLTYDNTLLNNGSYNLFYTITGNSLGSVSLSSSDVTFINGVAQFSISPSLVDSETLTLEITDITGGPTCNGMQCTSIVNVPSQTYNAYLEPTITVSSTSGCELDDILITFTNTIDASFNPTNGMQSVAYSINGTNYTEDVTFSNGNAVAIVSVDRFTQGSNQLVFFDTNNFVHCGDLVRSTTLNLIPAPPNPVFNILPDNRCDASSLEFGFDSPSGQFVNYSAVTFDIYQLGSEPDQFSERDNNTSLTNNTQSNGIDIDVINSNDVSALPDGDYVFVIRSVQDDNTPCRGLSQTEIDSYTTQGITIGLMQVGAEHIFDARMVFRIGPPDPVQLIQSNFQVCLVNGAVTLGDLSIFAGSNVNITVENASGQVLSDSYEITQSEAFTAVFTDENTQCSLGTENFNVSVVTEVSAPVLNANEFCSVVQNTVEDLDTSGQNITWFNAETSGTAYNNTDIIDANNAYWAEVTISGGCIAQTRTRANITFVNKAVTPIPLENEFCEDATPTISDLLVEVDPTATIQWYTGQAGDAYTSTSLPLDDANEYWVSQTIAAGCESDRVRVTYTLTSTARNPMPLTNEFCTLNGIPTLEDLSFEESSISRQGVLSFYSDEAGTTSIASNTTLDGLTSPIYVQQTISGTCLSDIIEVPFTVVNEAPSPTLTPLTFCLGNNPTVQDLLNALENQTSANVNLYEDESTLTILDGNLELASYAGSIYASQTIVMGCESSDRTLVAFTIENPTISISDFNAIFCEVNEPTLNDAYSGSEIVLWFDENDNQLSGTQTIEDARIYTAQIQMGDCVSETLDITMSVVGVETPVPSSLTANLCGIEEKTIEDLLEDENDNDRFVIPLNHELVWYNSNGDELDEDEVLQNGSTYSVSFRNTVTIDGVTISCESSTVDILVDLTVCSEDELFIPDAFSPNGDNVNDTFELLNIEFVFPDYEIQIFNRYGRLVFKGNTATGFWNGKSNQSGTFGGDVLPTGVYFYVLKFNRSGKEPSQGQVYLKR
ncbi:gliding motility-associated C-terminal domain-containing protein [Seonamhaeicola marinus]|uniref:Gliding motility-associated C-terminal domain-containing protein n=1 Tax=Seonamhaeicola marinus TaxID=1912246 RepID=A0A5D0I498_9FLAO|nr:gliding motility-associated C-terminal domain-containing protein [Seonamhaeicola marinus]TYA78525.1 gliding motility-associated C-terminal domain-containing protein [Seonamhaeicola marinus]